MKCKNCGATLDEDALFCRRCGTAVPETPEAKPKKQVKTVLSGITEQISGWFERIGKWISGTYAQVRNWFARRKGAGLFKNRRLLMLTGIGAALLVVLIVVIASAASCKKPKKLDTPEAVTAAVLEALNGGDGETLYEMTVLSVKTLGAHPEEFGEGETPEAVMQGYYERLARAFHAEMTERFGETFTLEEQTESELITGTEIFETNRALGLEATQYAEITGPLTVNGEQVKNIHIVAVELDGEWKPLVVYLY